MTTGRPTRENGDKPQKLCPKPSTHAGHKQRQKHPSEAYNLYRKPAWTNSEKKWIYRWDSILANLAGDTVIPTCPKTASPIECCRPRYNSHSLEPICGDERICTKFTEVSSASRTSVEISPVALADRWSTASPPVYHNKGNWYPQPTTNMLFHTRPTSRVREKMKHMEQNGTKTRQLQGQEVSSCARKNQGLTLEVEHWIRAGCLSSLRWAKVWCAREATGSKQRAYIYH